MALGAANDLPVVDLARATRLLLLMANERSPLYPRAAARWLSRFTTETRDLTPAAVADVAEALAALEHGDLGARDRLLAAVRT
jgi:hypothetical protein